jgi:hypothetical protein
MITPEDRRTLVEKLDQHRQALLTEVAGRTEAAMAGRQKPGDRTFKAMLYHRRRPRVTTSTTGRGEPVMKTSPTSAGREAGSPPYTRRRTR